MSILFLHVIGLRPTTSATLVLVAIFEILYLEQLTNCSELQASFALLVHVFFLFGLFIVYAYVI